MNGAKTLIQSQPWRNDSGDGITVAGSALTTDKSAATVHALTSTTYKRVSLQGPYQFTPSLEFRFRVNGTNNQTNVVYLYAMADPHGKGDHYKTVGTLTIKNGTQLDANSYRFVDEITIANEKWIDDVVVVDVADDDDIATLAINTQGYSDFVFVCTTLSSTGIWIDFRRI